MHLYAYLPHWKVLKHDYMSHMDVGINHRWSTASTMTSCIISTWQSPRVIKISLYMFKVDVGSNQRWYSASTMTSWHHFHLTVTQNCQNLTQLQRCYSVTVPSYACVPNWKVKTLYLCPKWRWEAIKGGNQPNHDIMASFLLNSHSELPKSDPASAV